MSRTAAAPRKAVIAIASPTPGSWVDWWDAEDQSATLTGEQTALSPSPRPASAEARPRTAPPVDPGVRAFFDIVAELVCESILANRREGKGSPAVTAETPSGTRRSVVRRRAAGGGSARPAGRRRRSTSTAEAQR